MQKISMLASVIASLVVGSTCLSALAQANTADVSASTKAGSDDSCSAGKCERGGKGRHGKGRGEGFQALKGTLTEDQQKQISAIKDSAKGQIAPQREKLQALRQQIESAKPGTDVTALKAEAKQLRDQVHASMKEAHEKMKAVLTPEQQATLAANRGGKRHHGGGGCDAGGKGCDKAGADKK